MFRKKSSRLTVSLSSEGSGLGLDIAEAARKPLVNQKNNMSEKEQNIAKDHINQQDEESTPRPKADVCLDTESSVAELVELNRKNLPGTFEEARKQVEQLSQSADARYMRVGAHILAVELEARFYRYGYGSKVDYAEEGLGLASTTWRREVCLNTNPDEPIPHCRSFELRLVGVGCCCLPLSLGRGCIATYTKGYSLPN